MIIFLRDLNHFCTGCYTCITDDKKCPFYEEKNRIMAEVESAPMKSFIDLTFNYRMAHRPRKSMFHKKAVIISTAVGSGAEKAVKYIADVLFYWGIPYILPYGICIQAMNWNGVREKKKQKEFLKRLEKARKAAIARGEIKVPTGVAYEDAMIKTVKRN